ncbi:MAG: hypothetical protein FD124_1698 [Alphaproteobacteria bacterium]|nr:MAG: hypothetical protein FD124_1698 [Alphaproteobacteria bacterium]
MAHGGEEIGLGAVGVLCGVARDAQVHRACVDLAFEPLQMRGDTIVARADLPEHGVEPVDETPDLVVARRRHRRIERLRFTDARDRCIEAPDRLRDRLLQTRGDDEADGEGYDAGHQRPEKNALHAFAQIRGARDQHEPPDLPPALHDRGACFDGARGQQPPDIEAAAAAVDAHVRFEAKSAADLCEKAPVGRLDPRVGNVRHPCDRAQHGVGALPVELRGRF